MEFHPLKITDGFLFVWNIENGFAFDDRMESPTFMAQNLEQTEWIMRISSEPIYLYLTRTDTSSTAEAIEVDVVVSVVSSDESDNLLVKENKLKFRKGVSNLFLFYPKQLSFGEYNLKIYCYLRKSEEPNVSLIRCSALTHVEAEFRNDIWKVQNFRYLMTNSPKMFILESTGKQLPPILLTGVLSKKSKLFHISVSVSNFLGNQRIFLIGKISVLSADGSLKLSIKGRFTLKGMSSLKFPMAISRAENDRYLTCGDLSLMCDFFISNGELHNEIIESCYIPNKQKIVADSLCSLEEENIPIVPIEDISEKEQDLKSSHEFEQCSDTLEDDPNYEYLDEKYCDVILTTGNKTFPVHKSILCLKSPVFKTMLETNMSGTLNYKVDIDDLDSDTLRLFLLFLYTEKLENLQWKMATKLLYSAVKYQVTSLKIKCSCFLEVHLSMSNVCEALQLADLYQDENLIFACRDFVLRQDAAEMFSSEEWKAFTVSNPALSADILQKYFLTKK